ncbi:MAG TPA: DegQ family serine endoprotease [Verrucomicrobiae bacterium]|nr:DegQ family serine endoprotease [Verrucomicrobiae bacterium]
MNQQSIWRRPQAILLAATLALGIGGVGIAVADRLGSHPALDLRMANSAEPLTHMGFAPVVKRVLPAVVSISSSKVTKVPAGMYGQDMPDLFQQFFGLQGGQMPQFQQPRTMREQALGSGVIMTPDGYILTNNHVVDDATSVKVTTSDKREFTAKIVGKDAKSDIAVLKIEASNLPVITVGDSSKAQVGDYALAVGNPFGVGQTVTMGIVSATGRSNLGIEDYEDFIQTDAPINPGNSGGALVNDRGELIGINTAIIAHGSEGNQGIGFAVPANMAVNVMKQIVDNGKVARAYLGIVPQDVTPQIARAFGETNMRGALVGDVSPNSPASQVGLQKGDIILDVNGKPVEDANSLRMTISMMAPGTTVSLKVWRNDADRDFSVKLGELPTETASLQKPDNGGNSNSALAGVSVQNLDADTAQQLGLPASSQGVVVTNVDPASSAADAGLQRGDVIQEVNRRPVRNMSDFDRAMSGSKSSALLLVNRHGSTMFVAV